MGRGLAQLGEPPGDVPPGRPNGAAWVERIAQGLPCSAGPAEHFDSNPIGIEGKERVIARLVAILLRREVNVCATREAACMRLINLLPSVNLEGEVLDADVVVAVGSTV